MLNLTNLKIEIEELKTKPDIVTNYPETVRLLKAAIQILEVLKEIQVIEIL